MPDIFVFRRLKPKFANKLFGMSSREKLAAPERAGSSDNRCVPIGEGVIFLNLKRQS
jgi:hypothetical protein